MLGTAQKRQKSPTTRPADKNDDDGPEAPETLGTGKPKASDLEAVAVQKLFLATPRGNTGAPHCGVTLWLWWA